MKCETRLSRLDEDYRLAVQARRRAASINSSECVAAVDVELRGASRLARRWSDKAIQEHVADAWDRFDEDFGQVHSVVEDAARLGNPAEETIVYQRWSNAHGCGHWMLPQAFS